MNIRKALARDANAIVEILLQPPPIDQMTDDNEAMRATCHRIIERPELGSILVAEDNGNIIGIMALSYPVAVHCGGPYGIIEDFVVTEKARGKGIGGQLAKAAIAEATANNCFEMQVNNPSDLGYPVYMRCGLTSTGRHLRKKLKS